MYMRMVIPCDISVCNTPERGSGQERKGKRKRIREEGLVDSRVFCPHGRIPRGGLFKKCRLFVTTVEGGPSYSW